MLAAINTKQYPYFDRLELVSDPDPVRYYYRPFQPLKAGNILPGFGLQKESVRWQQFFNGAEVHGSLLLNQFLNRPLVIGFYSQHWQGYGTHLLQHLNNLQYGVKAQGGNLLIVTGKREKELEKIVWNNSLSLSFYFDEENIIAESFGIYSDNDPVWNRFSGIDVNVPLLATYVISQTGRIEFGHIDPDFAEEFPSKEILLAVKQVAVPAGKILNITDHVAINHNKTI